MQFWLCQYIPRHQNLDGFFAEHLSESLHIVVATLACGGAALGCREIELRPGVESLNALEEVLRNAVLALIGDHGLEGQARLHQLVQRVVGAEYQQRNAVAPGAANLEFHFLDFRCLPLRRKIQISVVVNAFVVVVAVEPDLLILVTDELAALSHQLSQQRNPRRHNHMKAEPLDPLYLMVQDEGLDEGLPRAGGVDVAALQVPRVSCHLLLEPRQRIQLICPVGIGVVECAGIDQSDTPLERRTETSGIVTVPEALVTVQVCSQPVDRTDIDQILEVFRNLRIDTIGSRPEGLAATRVKLDLGFMEGIYFIHA